ncbi:MAG: hypothetical protein EOP62_22770 [Sphingomonadales bacterium]|nr:MAG: hypothetical protein EOP62_22770 [Sphingomonadales bacterium]
MNTRILTGVVLASAFALTACGSKTETTATTNTVVAAPVAPANTAAAGEETAPAAGATKLDFKILNKTGHTVVSFNVSPTTDEEWGEDILGKDTLADGESADITFDRTSTECKWDLKATYEDNDTTEMKSVDLCTIATVTLNP